MVKRTKKGKYPLGLRAGNWAFGREIYILMVLRLENTNKIRWDKDILKDPNYIKIRTQTLFHWDTDADKREAGRRNRNNPKQSAWRTARRINRKLDLKLYRWEINPASGPNQRLNFVLIAQPHRDCVQMVDFGQIKCSKVRAPNKPDIVIKYGSLGSLGPN